MSIAFSHDSTRLASASYDKTVKIWDASSGACLQTLEGHSNWAMSIAFSHDSTRLTSASYDKTVKIWDASSGACLQTLEGHNEGVTSVAFSHDSTRLASASDDKTFKIWDSSSGACLQTLSVERTPDKLSFDSTGSCLYTELGTIAIGSSEVSSIMNSAEPKRPQYLDIGISSDYKWITHGGKPMLWVPSEYRPFCSSMGSSTVGIGVASGRVWFCTLSLECITNSM
jgi:WD40 repeat protein